MKHDGLAHGPDVCAPRAAAAARGYFLPAQAHNSQLDNSVELKWAQDPPQQSEILSRFHRRIRYSALLKCSHRICVDKEEQLGFQVAHPGRSRSYV